MPSYALRRALDSFFSRAAPGIQFLLTGITLGLLYESLPEKDGVDELVLQVLILMLVVLQLMLLPLMMILQRM